MDPVDRLNWLIQHRVCTRQPSPGEVIGRACPDCGHHLVVHIGADACVVCELRAELRQLRERSG